MAGVEGRQGPTLVRRPELSFEIFIIELKREISRVQFISATELRKSVLEVSCF